MRFFPSILLAVAATGAQAQATAPINVSMTPSRTTGRVPLAVFFDASATSSTAASPCFHKCEFQWTFGDASSGTWSRGTAANTSRNAARGPVVAHVFETPGDYSVCVIVKDGANTSSPRCVNVTASDWPDDRNTVCVSASGNFTGCPSKARRASKTSDWQTALENIASSRKRLLFRCDEAWTAAAGATLSVTGPGLIGAYNDSGATTASNTCASSRPAVTFSGAFAVLTLAAAISDWRFMDINITGNGAASSAGVKPGSGSSDVRSRLTFLRWGVSRAGAGIQFNSTETAIVDSTIERISDTRGGVGIYGESANFFALMGTLVDDTRGGEHNVRLPFVAKAFVNNNTLKNPAAGKHNLKIHSYDYSGNWKRETKQVVVSDNRFEGANSLAMEARPQSSTYDELLQDVIVERNLFVSAPTFGGAITLSARGGTIRNNLIDADNADVAASSGFIEVSRRGKEPFPTQIMVAHNSFWTAKAVSAFTAIQIGNGVTNVTVQNNVAYAPNITGGKHRILDDQSGAATTCASCNSLAAQVKAGPSPFARTPPTQTSHWVSRGYAVGGGVTGTGVLSDYLNAARAATPAIGAVQP